jgi:hypothetical protein
MGKRTVAYRVLLGRPEGWRSHGTYRRAWENNVKIDLQEEEFGRLGLD